MTAPLTAGSMCTGYGGLDMAVTTVPGARPVWVADPDPGAALILAHRYPDVPNLGDITTVDWTTTPPVDVLTAGFPCQDLSYAGLGAGIAEGTRSGLWLTIARAVYTLRPRLLVLENVRAVVTRRPGLDVVLASLAVLGFDAEWVCVRASDIGAPHRRERWFCLAWPADPPGPRQQRDRLPRRPARDSTEAAATHPHDLGEHRDRADRRPPQRHPAGTGRPAENPHSATGGQRRIPAPGPPQGGRARADAGRRSGTPAAHPQSQRRHQGRTRPARISGGPDAAFSSTPVPADTGPHPLPEPGSDDVARADQPGIGWGAYGPAIARWETTLGRPAPRPTEPGRTGERLSPRFVEWLMGLPDGWVTHVPDLTRNQQLHALGNGVIPHHAAAAPAHPPTRPPHLDRPRHPLPHL